MDFVGTGAYNCPFSGQTPSLVHWEHPSKCKLKGVWLVYTQNQWKNLSISLHTLITKETLWAQLSVLCFNLNPYIYSTPASQYNHSRIDSLQQNNMYHIHSFFLFKRGASNLILNLERTKCSRQSRRCLLSTQFRKSALDQSGGNKPSPCGDLSPRCTTHFQLSFLRPSHFPLQKAVPQDTRGSKWQHGWWKQRFGELWQAIWRGKWRRIMSWIGLISAQWYQKEPVDTSRHFQG